MRSPTPGSRRGSWSNSSTLTIADKLRFEAILNKAGHIALDCPLSGTGAQAKIRDLVVYASGDSEAIARCTDLFADFAKQSADLGAFGNGSRMKFIANHLVAIHNVATAEAMVLAERAGLDPKMVVDMVGPGAGSSRMFQLRAPMMVERVYEPATMKVSIWKKDMAIIAEFADRCRLRDPDVHADPAGLYRGDGDGIGRSGHGGRVRGAEEDHHHRTAGPRAGIAASAPRRDDRLRPPSMGNAALHQSKAARPARLSEPAAADLPTAPPMPWLSLDHLELPSDKSLNQ